MQSWLLTWNPAKFDWDRYAHCIETVARDGRVPFAWSCGNTKRIQPGDEFFFLRQGRAQPGLIGHGVVTSAPYIDTHWSTRGSKARYVDVLFEHLSTEPVITSRELLNSPDLRCTAWRAQASGSSLPEGVVRALRRRWPTRNVRQRTRPSNQIDRSDDLVALALFLARFGERRERRRTASPPKELGTRSWLLAYATFFSALGAGRSFRSFVNSLKNARDVFDSRFGSGRIGWRRAGQDRTPVELPDQFEKIFKRWSAAPRLALWEHIAPYFSPEATQASEQLLRDIDIDEHQAREGRVKSEGGRKYYVSGRPERDPSLRASAVNHHGVTCKACGLNFGAVYGPWGRDYIEVHHSRPLASDAGQERLTDPLTDLTVLCANCHRMMHRRRDVVLTVEELQAKIDRERVREWFTGRPQLNPKR